MTSSSTRLIIHLTKLGGEASPCKEIPDDIFEECKRKYLPLPKRKGIAKAQEEIVPPDVEGESMEDNEAETPSPSVGAQNVVQVITDNASNCASMGRKLEEEFPSIVWTPCASHCLDLLMEDIGNLLWVKAVVNQANDIVRFINAKVRVLAIYRGYSNLELKKPSKTRFAATWLLLERLYDVQNKLQKTVVSDEFKEWMEHESTAVQQDAKAVQRLCLKEDFWNDVKAIVIVVTPLYKVLRMTDMEGSTLGLLYHMMEQAIKEIEEITILDGEPPAGWDDIVYLARKRWDWMKRPIHGFAAIFHPAFKNPDLFMDTKLNEDRQAYLGKVLPEGKHGDFLQELINYSDQRGTAFTPSVCWKRESLVKPLFWWESFGFQVPTLRKVALRILAQDCSAGACERNWSAYSLVHTKIRNKLSTRQLERLIYCRSNLRMLRTMHEMPMARQVNVDELKLSAQTLKSVTKDRDPEEEEIFRDLYMELEEIDRRVSRTRSQRKTRVRSIAARGVVPSTTHGAASTSHAAGTSRCYVRRGPTTSSTTREIRDPNYDDEGNLLSEGDYGDGASSDDGDYTDDDDESDEAEAATT
ncbi:hypothetical protein L7F22_020581 [Adiantum nelumboides]|nr:hypothetical protein [Adiantum nelumboides]